MCTCVGTCASTESTTPRKAYHYIASRHTSLYSTTILYEPYSRRQHHPYTPYRTCRQGHDSIIFTNRSIPTNYHMYYYNTPASTDSGAGTRRSFQPLSFRTRCFLLIVILAFTTSLAFSCARAYASASSASVPCGQAALPTVLLHHASRSPDNGRTPFLYLGVGGKFASVAL